MKRLFILVIAFCFSVANADEVTGKIISCGIFAVPFKHTTQEVPEALSGTMRIYSGLPNLIVATNRLTAKIGVHFGIIYEISNLPVKDGEEVELVRVYKYPTIKKPDGTTSQGYEWRPKEFVKDGRVVDYFGYGLDHDYELVPGVWEFEIKYKGKTLCAQSFVLSQK
jgi:hypothetical protein